MKSLRVATIACLLVASLCVCFAQSPAWSKLQVFQGVADERDPQVIKVSDGSFYVACSVFTSETEVQHFDSAGSWVWTKVFPGSFLSFDANSSRVAFITMGSDNYATLDGGHELVLYSIDSTGAVQWSTQMDAGVGMPFVKMDAGSNEYVAGTVPATGNSTDVYLAKYDSLGAKLWSNSHDYTSNDFATNLYVDAGGVSVTYEQVGDVDDPDGVGIGRYGVDGTFLWTNRDSVPSVEESSTTDANGKIYLAYYSVNDQKTTIRKMNSAGSIAWTTKVDAAGAADIQVAASGNIYVFGFGPALISLDSTGQQRWATSLPSGGGSWGKMFIDSSENIFVSMPFPTKLDSTGAILWKASYNDNIQSRSIALDMNGDPVSVGATNDSGTSDIALVKLSNSDGTEVSRNQEDLGLDATASTSSATDPAGNTYVFSIGSAFFADPIPGNLVTDSNLVKYGADGSVAWTLDLPPTLPGVNAVLTAVPGSGVLVVLGTQATLYDAAGNVVWTNPDLLPADGMIARADAAGNVYIGYGSGDATGSSEISKFDASGNLLAVYASTPGVLTGIAIDGSGNVYACGEQFIDDTVFGAALDKFGPLGSKQWRNFAASSTAIIDATPDNVLIGSTGNPILVGTEEHGSDNSDHGFVTQMSASNGTPMWFTEPAGSVRVSYAAVDTDGSVLVSGQGNTIAAPNLLAAKLTSAGVATWVKTFSGGQKDLAVGLALGPTGNILVPAIGGTPGRNDDDLVVGYDTSGNLLFPGNGGAYFDSGWKSIDRTLSAGQDAAGSVYMAGRSFAASGVEAGHLIKFTSTVGGGGDSSQFVDQAVQSPMSTGVTYPITVTMKNTGTTTWTLAGGYRLDCVEGSIWSQSTVALGGGDSIAPGQSKTFFFNVIAPSSANTYAMQWSMDKSGVQFGQASTLLNIPVAAPDNADFISQNVPLNVTPGSTFTARATMKNTGSSTWTQASGYCLLSLNPTNNKVWGTNRLLVPSSANVAPGQQVQLLNTLTAPLTPGTYTMQWQMAKGTTLFGEQTVSLNFHVLADNAQFVTQKVITDMAPGVSFNATVTMKNTGGSTWTQADGFCLISQNPQSNTVWGTNRLLVPSSASVAPGTQIVCSNTLTAPSIPGTYTLQWKMYHNGAVFGDITPAQTVTVGSPGNAQYVSAVLPTSIKAGATFTAKVTMQNTGTTTWTQAGGYSLISQDPLSNTVWGTNRLLIPSSASVAPGAQVVLFNTCKAPSTPGTYPMQWQMYRNGTVFGQLTPIVMITVTP